MQLSNEMKPTRRTHFIRQCKLIQLTRFLSLNLRILKVALFPPNH